MTKGKHRGAATDLRMPLVGRALEVVQSLKPRDGWLFPSVSRKELISHQQQTYMQVKVNYLQPYCKSRPDHVRQRLSVMHWSPHDLRRTGRTLLPSMGCPNEVGKAILGHVQPGVVGVYNIYDHHKERRHWLTLMAGRPDSLLS